MSKAIEDVRAERKRQINVERFGASHDAGHDQDELSWAAACYATAGNATVSTEFIMSRWPWSLRWWKPTTKRRNLVKAAALLIAEIDRLDSKLPEPLTQKSAAAEMAISPGTNISEFQNVWLDGEACLSQIKRLVAELAAAKIEIERLSAGKHQAYGERNKLVLALAKLFPSGLRKTDIEGWDDEWHWCVTIDLPTGQVSWHIRQSEKPLFDWLPPYEKPWDGHDTEEKYRRLDELKPNDCWNSR